MADVARRVGVSRALVSLVFRNQPGAGEETRRRVLRAADELGYRPDSAARLLARGRSRTIGVMLTLHQPFEADIVEAVYPEAERLGYDVLLSASAPGRDERKAVEALLSHRCEGLILLGSQATLGRLDELGRRSAVVVVGRTARGANVDSVHTAEGKGVSQVVGHLVELGHRRIAHIDGGREPGAAERRRAYRAAMRRHGLAESIRVLPGSYDEESGSAAGRLLLAEEHLPSAVFAGNDRCAMGLMHTLGRAGVDVPGDVSVVGYDDNHLSHLSHIDLSTVRQDAGRLAEHAVRFAVERLDDASLAPREAVLDPKLVVRGTSSAPPDGRPAPTGAYGRGGGH
ncbi:MULTISPECIES: LacI family DNA-binding transcriptional regulator [unclassified Streptomyces]|uniref:LacI family DNA-binding transcriptional regulator n=1 Tax=unclassified Streptomyces TaxID=2593676 RepID=UPI002E2BEDB6|nr:LacI family DNA-binding transcriptional regulator [Streptomyces sp. NBC_01429]